jgi:hypothetical protein
MKMFWSWQSDTPGKIGRYFVRAALDEAVEELKQPDDVEEPTTAETRETMHVDQDREGVQGSPALFETIKKKIEASTVVIADITPVSTIAAKDGIKEKRNMNPNVALELGYALHARTEQNVLLVLNKHYGGREFLPFDLGHLGGPIIYNLKPDATTSEIKAEQAKLRGVFVSALRGYLTSEAASQEAATKLQRVPSKTSKAVWFDAGEALAEFGDNDDVTYEFDDDKGIYLRIAPWSPQPQPFAISQLYERLRAFELGMLHKSQGGIPDDNRYGAIKLEPVGGSGGRIRAATQVFPDGEIWSLGRDLLVDNEYAKKVIPMRLVESAIHEVLSRNIAFLREQLAVSPPYRIEFGAVGVHGYRLGIANDDYDQPYEIRDESFSSEFVMTSTTPEAIDAARLKIYEEFFRLTGYARPANLFGFPPK